MLFLFTPSAAINQYLYAIYGCPDCKADLVKNTGIFKAEVQEQEEQKVLNEVEPEEVVEELAQNIQDDVEFF